VLDESLHLYGIRNFHPGILVTTKSVISTVGILISTLGILVTGLERLPTPTGFGVTENLFMVSQVGPMFDSPKLLLRGVLEESLHLYGILIFHLGDPSYWFGMFTKTCGFWCKGKPLHGMRAWNIYQNLWGILVTGLERLPKPVGFGVTENLFMVSEPRMFAKTCGFWCNGKPLHGIRARNVYQNLRVLV